MYDDICPYLNEAGYHMKKGHFTDTDRNDPTSMNLDLQWPDKTMYAFLLSSYYNWGGGECLSTTFSEGASMKINQKYHKK